MRILTIAALPILFLSSCAKQEPAAPVTGPMATVVMRDGTRATGQVLSTSPTEVKLAGNDNITRTIPMAQVRRIDYGDAPPAAAPVQTAGRPAPAPAPQYEPPHEDHYHAVQSAITSKSSEVPVGAEVSVRVEETIDSGKASEGQTYVADVTKDVPDSNGDVVIPRGSNAQIVIRSASKGGRIRGASDLVLDLASISIDGQSYQVSTTDMQRTGSSGVGANKRTAEYTGGGAAFGAIIGAIAGGGKGAAIGAGAGAGAGALTQVLTKGSIKVPVETVLTFKLDRPLRVVAR